MLLMKNWTTLPLTATVTPPLMPRLTVSSDVVSIRNVTSPCASMCAVVPPYTCMLGALLADTRKPAMRSGYSSPSCEQERKHEAYHDVISHHRALAASKNIP